MADDVQVKFGADSTGITTGAKQALDGVKNFSEQAKSHVAGLTSTFGKLQEMMLGIAAIVAGGALFKEMINSTLEMTGEVTKLQKAFGMSLEEANKTKSSLDLLGLSTDTYTQMATRLDRQLRTGSDALAKMGLTAKDLDLGQKGVMDKAISLLGDYKAGIDRNIAAQVLFGRGGDEATKLLRLGLDSVQQKAKELEEQFHLTITPQDQANARQYKLVVSELGMAFDGIKKAIGEAVLPYLTAFGNWFVQVAPKIIGGMREGMAGVIEAAFSAAEGFINFVTRVLNGVYNLFVVWEYVQAKLGNTTVDQANSSLDQFDSALKNLSKFRDDAVAVIRDLKSKVLAAKPFESIDLGVGKPSANKSASGLLSDGGGGKDATSAAMRDLDGQMKVLREGLAQKKEILQQELAQHQITEGQKVDATRKAIDEEYQAELALLQKQLQIGRLSLSQRQSVLNKIKELEARHRTEELQLDGQAIAVRQKYYQQFFDAIQGAFNSQLRGLLAGTTTWSQAFKSILGDLIISFIQAVEKMGFEWLAGELARTTATQAGVAARTASEGAGAATSMAVTFAGVIKSIMASAAETFAGIFGFLSPVMGPAAAGPAGAGMATVAAVASAVPALDVGTPWVASDGLAMIHKGEAVVPASVNGAWQNGGLGGGDTHVHFGINAIDAQNGAAFLKNNMGMLAKMLASHLRTNPGVSFA